MALEAVRGLRFDLCRLGACAVAEEGVSALGAEGAAMNRGLVSASAAVVVAATADRVGARAPLRVAPLARSDRLIVEAGAPEAAMERMRRAGAERELAAAGG